MWLVEYTDQFGVWFESLSEKEQELVATRVEELMVHGPDLGVHQWIGSSHCGTRT
jgi:hypothetical protein